MLARRSTLFAACLAAVLLLAPPAAHAGYRTTVVVSLKLPAFHGRLKSSRHACVGQRKVLLYRRRGGQRRLIGADRTDAGGKWLIPAGKKLARGTYVAKAPARGRCGAARSKAIPIG